MTTSDFDDEDERDGLHIDSDELYEHLTEVTRDIRKLRSELTKALRERDCVRRLLGLSPAPDAVS
jgi:hypothetical protein